MWENKVCVFASFQEPNRKIYTGRINCTLRATIQCVTKRLADFVDGTHDIIRHTNTATTHMARSGHGGLGEMPYVGITKETCSISDDVIGQDILLIDDLYTKTVNIDEDCIQALLDKGARSAIFLLNRQNVKKIF